MRNNTARLVYTAAYIAVIVLANVLTARLGLVPVGFGLVVTAGTFAAGAALVIRDGLQMHAGRVWMLAAIVAGALLSAVTSTPALALASGLAFAVSELVDWGIFTPLRGRNLPAAVLVSSVISAPIDTVLFLYLAGFPVTLNAVLGQFVVKTLIAGVVAIGLAATKETARP